MEEEAGQTSRKRKRPPPVTQGGRENSRKTIKVDLIEKLPYHLVQSILGRLPADAAAKSATVCKKWYQSWKTSSILDLDVLRYRKKSYPDSRNIFLSSMQSALTNHDMEHLQDLRIWSMFYYDRDREVHTTGELVVISAFQRGKIRALDLNFGAKRFEITEQLCLHLPRVFFSMGTYLTRVTLEACLFPTCDAIKFTCLKQLTLSRVYISDEMLSNVIKNSPMMEYLSLTDCRHLKNIKFSSSQLKSLLIDRCNQLIKVVLDVPYLVFFSYNGYQPDNPRNRFDFLRFVARCLNLVSTVKISAVNVRAYYFANLIAKFKNLENLHLTNCRFEEPPRILIPSLKILEVRGCRNQRGMVIDTPDLEHLQLAPPPRGGFKVKRRMVFACLKTLYLGPGMFISNKAFPVVMQSMELLQSLELRQCRGFKKFNIENIHLTTLIVDRCCNVVEADIFAPNLVSFKYVGHVLLLHRIVASATLHAQLHLSKDKVQSKLYRGKTYERLITFLETFNPNCRDLTLVLKDSTLHMPLNKVSRTFPIESLRNLNVTYKFDNKSFLCLVSTALAIARCQEELYMETAPYSIHMKFANMDQGGVGGNDHECLRDHLSEVTMKKFGGDKDEMEVVEYLLKTAANLKTMRISLLRTHLEANRGQIISTIRRYRRIAKNSTVQIH